MRTPIVAVLVLVACRSPSTPSETASGSEAVPRCPDPNPVDLADRCERGEVAACLPGARGLARSARRSDRERAVHLHELACARDSAEGCAALALDLASGKYVEHDVVRAAALRTALCDRGLEDSCYELALQFLAGDGVGEDHARGEQLLAAACQARFAEACEHLAGSEHREMFQRAFEPYLTACRAGDPTSCRSAHRMARYGHLPSDVPREDWEATSRAALAACTAGDSTACASLATLSEPSAGHREGGRDDPAASQAYRTRACELGDAPSCALLAGRRLGTPYGRPDYSGGKALFERACQLGDETSCGRASALVEDPAARRALLLRGCELADRHACAEAVEMLRRGIGGPRDTAGVQRLENQLCSQGSAEHCLVQGHYAQQRGDLATARRYELRACRDQGYLDGCRDYASLLRDACQARDATSCQELDRFLASLPPERRGLAAFQCCRDRLELTASPIVQLAVFADALLRLDASAVRTFVAPGSSIAIQVHRTFKRSEEDYHLRVRAASLDVKALQRVLFLFAEIDAIHCPETFRSDRATCTIEVEGLRGQYDLRRHGTRVYVVEIREHS